MANRRTGALIAATLLVALVAAPSAAAELDRQAWKRYDASAGGPFFAFELTTDQRTWRAGGVSFDVAPTDAFVYVAALDDTGRRVAARYAFVDAEDDQIVNGALCSTGTLDVPSGAVALRVYPSPLVTPCPLNDPHGPATAGLVYVEFHT